MAVKNYKPTSPGRRGMTGATFEEITKAKPERSLIRLRAESGRPQRPWAGHRPPSRRRQPALHAHGRLQARQARHPGPGGGDRVRSESLGPPGAAALCRRREALHRRPARPEGGRHGHVRPGGRDPPGQQPAAGQHPAGHADPQHRAASRATAASWCARPGRRRSCWARKATSPQSVCRRAKSAWSARRAMPPSARLATRTTATSSWARPAASATWASARRCAARPCRPRDHPHGGGEGRQPIGLPGPKSPGASRPWATRPAATRSTDQYIVGAGRSAVAKASRLGTRRVRHDVTIIEEGSVCRAQAAEEDRGDEPARREEGHPHLEPGQHDLPADGGAHRSPSTTAAATCRSTSPRTWSGTSWASSPRPAPSAATSAARRRPRRRRRLRRSRPSNMADEHDVRATSAISPGMSAQKVRLVVDLVRGRPADEALEMLSFMPKAAAEPVREGDSLGDGQRRGELRPEPRRAGRRPDLGRRGPDAALAALRARGRFKPILRRSSHITVILQERRRRRRLREEQVWDAKFIRSVSGWGSTRPWASRWFAGRGKYAGQLHEDFARSATWWPRCCRGRASSPIDIERFPNNVHVTIHTAKPGIVIGRKGASVKEVRRQMRGADRHEGQARHRTRSRSPIWMRGWWPRTSPTSSSAASATAGR